MQKMCPEMYEKPLKYNFTFGQGKRCQYSELCLAAGTPPPPPLGVCTRMGSSLPPAEGWGNFLKCFSLYHEIFQPSPASPVLKQSSDLHVRILHYYCYDYYNFAFKLLLIPLFGVLFGVLGCE